MPRLKLLRSCTFDSDGAIQRTRKGFGQDPDLNAKVRANMRWSGMRQRIATAPRWARFEVGSEEFP